MGRSQVAVVIACHDLGDTVGEALDSALAQTLAPAEVVIVDDGSTDVHTLQVLATLERDGRRVVRTPNRGVGAARNLGVRLTASPCIVLLDADDVLQPTYLERTTAVLKDRADLDFVTTAVEAFGASSFTWSPARPELVQSLVFGVPHISSMMRRHMWNAVGGYDEATRCNDELEFWTRVLEAGFVGELIAEPLLRYRVRPGSLYHEVIEPGRYVEHMARFWEGHRATLERHGEEILLAKERFIIALRRHQQHVVHRQATLGRQLDALHRELAEVASELDRLGDARVRLGDLRRTTPLSPAEGSDRGLPVAARYGRDFLGANRDVIQGRVLVVGTRRPADDDLVATVEAAKAEVTRVAAAQDRHHLQAGSFDCLVATGVLTDAPDPRAALAEQLRLLAPGGVLLAMEPALAAGAQGGERRHFTRTGLLELLAEELPVDHFAVESRGNVLACAAALYGLADHELAADELEQHDPGCPLLHCVRAVKPGGARGSERRSDRRQPAALILALHRVAAEEHDPHQLCIAPAALDTMLDELRGCCDVVPLGELVAGLHTGTLPDRSVALSFDDGYLDALTTAAPLLAERGIPATFFVTGVGLDGASDYWWDCVGRVLLGDMVVPQRLELEVGGESLRLDTTTREQRRQAHTIVWQALVKLPAAAQRAMVSALREWAGPAVWPVDEARPMTSDEVSRLAALPGMTIGAHTTHHLWLPAHPEDVQRAELAEHRARLEGILGREVDLLCYPFGAHDTTTRSLAREHGLRAAVTTREAVVHPGTDPFSLPRLEVTGGSFRGLVERVSELLKHG